MVIGQQYPCPALEGCAWSWGRSRAAASKGSMTYAFTHMGNLIWILGVEFGPQNWEVGSDLGKGEGENSPYVWKHRSLTPLGPLPKNQIEFVLSWILGLEFGPQNWEAGIDLKKGENYPCVWKHWSSTPFGRCQKTRLNSSEITWPRFGIISFFRPWDVFSQRCYWIFV